MGEEALDYVLRMLGNLEDKFDKLEWRMDDMAAELRDQENRIYHLEAQIEDLRLQ